jgi:hypothetical protein
MADDEEDRQFKLIEQQVTGKMEELLNKIKNDTLKMVAEEFKNAKTK